MQAVSKSEFAKRAGRNPSQVTRWIASGKLSPPALNADGTIDLALGLAQVKTLLDPTQQLGLRDRPPIVVDEEADQALGAAIQAEAATPGKKTDTSRYLTLKADEKELDVEGKRRRMAADSGRWMETAAAARDFARDLGSIFTDLESWVLTAGQDLADALGIDPRAATLIVRKSLHKFRAQQAEKRRGEAEAMPELVEEQDLQAAE